MIRSTDVGSLPLPSGLKLENFSALAESYNARKYFYPDRYAPFRDAVIKGYLDKQKRVDIPNYPQFRDMNEMFRSMINGVEKINGAYVFTDVPSITASAATIPEVSVIMEEAGRIYEEVGEKFRMKVCITGPYTLSYPFGDSTGYACSTIGGLLKDVVKSNIFDEKRGKVELVVFDEPLLGLINDPRLDNGSPWRDGILKSLEDLLQVAKAKGAETGLHLHSTSVDVMGLNNLDVIESHFDDPFYQTENTKRLLEKHEKWTKLPITYTQYDKLISTDEPELVAAVWKKIKKGKIDPAMYLEPWETMSLRLEKLGKMFGERGKYAGGECGLLSFPTYDCAMESLRRQSLAIADYNSKALG